MLPGWQANGIIKHEQSIIVILIISSSHQMVYINFSTCPHSLQHWEKFSCAIVKLKLLQLIVNQLWRCSFTRELFLQLQFNLLVEVGHIYERISWGKSPCSPYTLFRQLCLLTVSIFIQKCSITVIFRPILFSTISNSYNFVKIHLISMKPISNLWYYLYI